MKPGNFPFFLLVNILAALLVGYLLDYWTGMTPTWIIVGILYAIIGSFCILIYRDRKKQKANENK